MVFIKQKHLCGDLLNSEGLHHNFTELCNNCDLCLSEEGNSQQKECKILNYIQIHLWFKLFIKYTISYISVFHRWSFARAACSCDVKLSEIFNSLQSGWQTELAGRWAQMTTNERRENVAASRRLLSGRSFYQSLKWSPSQSQWRQRTTSTGWGG